MYIKIKGTVYRILFKKRFIPVGIKPILSSFTNAKDIRYKEGSSLTGKIALVTGGHRGIGLAIASYLYREGARIIITGRDEQKLKDVSTRFDSNRFNYLVWDISNTLEVDNMLSKALSIYGKLDILVNNAGVNTNKEGKVLNFDSMYPADLHYINDINVIGTKNICDAFVKACSSGASILNVVSNTALRPALQSYFISKWAIYSYTKAMASQCRAKNITINGISPGPIKTNMMWKKGDSIVRKSRNRRIGLPEEIGELAVMVVKSSFKGLNGKIYLSDGGELLF